MLILVLCTRFGFGLSTLSLSYRNRWSDLFSNKYYQTAFLEHFHISTMLAIL